MHLIHPPVPTMRFQSPLKQCISSIMTQQSGEERAICPKCSVNEIIPDPVLWIGCEKCERWYHVHCLQLRKEDVPKIVEFYCDDCILLSNGELKILYKRASSRRKTEINYVALNDGDVMNSFKDSSTLVHPYIKLFQDWEPSDRTESTDVIELDGNELTLQYAMRTKIPKPIKISLDRRDGSGLVVPDFTLDELVEDLGEDYQLEVMNVMNQENVRMSVSEWRDYFQSPSANRERILNVLSLEISHGSIGKSIKRPTYVEDIDLVDKIWPLDNPNDPKPKVSKYCLMGVENSYTDFHLDFAGTSVYYTILKGSKQFIFFPPTKTNLKKYYKWIMKQDDGSLLEEGNFLPNCGLEKGIKVELNKGDLLIIPSGWIHGVWTPTDTIVIGGNFLTCFNIDTQLKIIELEILTKVNKKFRFPNFNKLMVLTTLEILKNVDETGIESQGEAEDESKIKLGADIDLKSCKELLHYLEEILQNNKVMKKNGITKSLIGGSPINLLNKFRNFIKINESNDLVISSNEIKEEANQNLDMLRGHPSEDKDAIKKRRVESQRI